MINKNKRITKYFASKTMQNLVVLRSKYIALTPRVKVLADSMVTSRRSHVIGKTEYWLQLLRMQSMISLETHIGYCWTDQSMPSGSRT